MKVIFSRKGLDSSFGEYPSPILPDGILLPWPIPVTQQQKEEDERGIPYRDMRFGGQLISEIINQLNPRFDYQYAHLDPDVDETRFGPRPEGWLPIFGQTGRPQFHLEKQEVDKDGGEGNLFLFYGWFRHTRYDNGRLCYVQPKDGGRDLHVIFGWLQIGCSYDVNNDRLPPWVGYHPHVVNRELYQRIYHHNKIYVASEQLNLSGKNLHLHGGGIFPQFKKILQLTDTEDEENRRSYWRLPRWFYHDNPERRISCHQSDKPWLTHDDYVILKTAKRGQEFVFNTENYREAISWVRSLFE
jgi:hypothetical protein